MTTSTTVPEVWFLTGSQGMYGPETLEQVATQSQGLVATLAAAPELPVRVVWKPVLLDSGSIHRAILEANSAHDCVGVVAWMHTFSPAKMWISGLDALQKPLLHLHTQAGHGPSVVDHRHGLHEPEPVRARRPRVRPHPVPPAASRARPWPVTWSRRSWSRGSRRGRAQPSGVTTCDTSGWPASATTCATWR